MGPAMVWNLATLEWQGESLVDTFHVSYIIKGRLLNHGAAINYWIHGILWKGELPVTWILLDIRLMYSPGLRR